MTRETKIGLLVGLAFIIVIGILLSDHLTSATEPQQAELVQVAGNVRNGVTAPGTANPPITTVITPPANVAPQATVPTKEELTPKQPPVEIVQIGGTSPQQPSHAITMKPQQPAAPHQPTLPSARSQEPPITVVDASGPTSAKQTPAAPTTPPVVPGNSSLAQVARTFNEEIVGANGQPLPKNESSRSEPTKPTLAAAALPPGAKQYKAEAGDSVSRLAARFLGGNTTANRNAIIAANPTLQKNPDIIVSGRTYVMPAPGAPVAPPAAATAAPSAPSPAPVEIVHAPAAPAVAPASAEHFYTVKNGDSLTKIAVEQLGSAAAVPAIVDLNKETLKGKDVIRPNMKLRLPAKPMASAE
jgi:nucleoid-associated protein YgaU